MVYGLSGVGTFKWFPDSSAILVREKAGAQSALRRVAIADGKVTELDWGTFLPGLPSIAEGGRTLLWFECDRAGRCNLIRIDTQTKSRTSELMNVLPMRINVVSPDGKWLAIIGRAPSSDVASLFVRPVASGGKLVEIAPGSRGQYRFVHIHFYFGQQTPAVSGRATGVATQRTAHRAGRRRAVKGSSH